MVCLESSAAIYTAAAAAPRGVPVLACSSEFFEQQSHRALDIQCPETVQKLFQFSCKTIEVCHCDIRSRDRDDDVMRGASVLRFLHHQSGFRFLSSEVSKSLVLKEYGIVEQVLKMTETEVPAASSLEEHQILLKLLAVCFRATVLH